MALTREQALEYTLRFVRYPGFPNGEREPEAQEALISAFSGAARDQKHAELIAQYLERRVDPNTGAYIRFCPLPGEVFVAATDTAQALRYAQTTMDRCDRCHGTGWIISSRNDDGYEFAEACECRKGVAHANA